MKRLKKLFRRRSSDIHSGQFGQVELGDDPILYSPSSTAFRDHLAKKEFAGPVKVETGELCVPLGSDFPSGSLHLTAAILKVESKPKPKTSSTLVSQETAAGIVKNPVTEPIESNIQTPHSTSENEDSYVVLEPTSPIPNEVEDHIYESVENIEDLEEDFEPEVTQDMVKTMRKRLNKSSKMLAKTDKKLKRHEKRLLSLYDDLSRVVRHLGQLRSRPNVTEQAKVLQKIKELMEGIDVSEFEGEVRRFEPALYKQYMETKTSKDAAELIQRVNDHRQNLLKLESLVRRKRLEWNCQKFDIHFSPVPTRPTFKTVAKKEKKVDLEVRGRAIALKRLDAAIATSSEESMDEDEEEVLEMQVQATIVSPVETSV